MGRNTVDSCFWLHILRCRGDESKDNIEIKFTEDEMRKVKDTEPIKN